MNSNIQKYIHADGENERIFHSNAYARVAQGKSLGSTDAQSFNQRLHIHRNRQAVRHYGASMIGQGAIRHAATSMARPVDDAGPQKPMRSRAVPHVSRPTQILPPRRSFYEPPGRSYNPYG